jgi:hypothetical protein
MPTTASSRARSRSPAGQDLTDAVEHLLEQLVEAHPRQRVSPREGGSARVLSFGFAMPTG